MIEPITSFKLESPGGEVEIKANCKHGRVIDVIMTPQPCFVVASDIQVSYNFSYCKHQQNIFYYERHKSFIICLSFYRA